MLLASRVPLGPGLKYERTVSASTRRLPWTTIEFTDTPTPAGSAEAALGRRASGKKPNIPIPRSKPATTSPRFTRTHMSMRNAPLYPRGRPQWRVTAKNLPQCALLSFQISLDVSVTSTIPVTLSPPHLGPRIDPRIRLPLGRRQMNDVIESCKYHQHDDDRETDPKPYFLGPFRERTAAQSLDSVEQKVTAVE